MQSNCAEMLRLATWRMCEAGIVPIMLIHDGILLEETDLERIEHAKEIMLKAGRDVCDGFEVGALPISCSRVARAITTSAQWQGRCGRPS
jgi:hypothetical protein